MSVEHVYWHLKNMKLYIFLFFASNQININAFKLIQSTICQSIMMFKWWKEKLMSFNLNKNWKIKTRANNKEGNIFNFSVMSYSGITMLTAWMYACVYSWFNKQHSYTWHENCRTSCTTRLVEFNGFSFVCYQNKLKSIHKYAGMCMCFYMKNKNNNITTTTYNIKVNCKLKNTATFYSCIKLSFFYILSTQICSRVSGSPSYVLMYVCTCCTWNLHFDTWEINSTGGFVAVGN